MIEAFIKSRLRLTEYKCKKEKATHESDPETKKIFGVVLNPIYKNK